MSYEDAFRHHLGIGPSPSNQFSVLPSPKEKECASSDRANVASITASPSNPQHQEAKMEVKYCRLIPYIQISLEASRTSLAQTYNSPTQPEKSERKGGGILKTKFQLLSARIAPPQGSLQAAQDSCRCRLLSPRVVCSITPITLVSISSRSFQYAHLTHPIAPSIPSLIQSNPAQSSPIQSNPNLTQTTPPFPLSHLLQSLSSSSSSSSSPPTSGL